MFDNLSRTVSRRLGRWRNSVVKRRHIAPLFDAIAADSLILEIGGGYNPRFTKSTHPHVRHLDHASTADLRAKYGADPNVAHLIGNIQHVDFVFDGKPIETLIPADLRFDLIFGSHVLEHQVDLVGHLQSIEQLLKPDGRVIHVIPDLRTCFDALRFPSVTSDALVVHHKRPAIHQGKQVFDFLSRCIDKNIGYRMHDADFNGARFSYDLRQAYDAMLASENDRQAYSDTHAWTFTPESFRLMMVELRLLGLTRLVPTVVSPQYGNQFLVELRRAPGTAEMSADVLQRLAAERFELTRQQRI